MTGGLQDSRVGGTERCSVCQLLCPKSKLIRCHRCPWSLCVVQAGRTTGIVINWSCQNCRNARDRIIFSSPRAFHLALHFAPARPLAAGRQVEKEAASHHRNRLRPPSSGRQSSDRCSHPASFRQPPHHRLSSKLPRGRGGTDFQKAGTTDSI